MCHMHIVACSNKTGMFKGFNWWMNIGLKERLGKRGSLQTKVLTTKEDNEKWTWGRCCWCDAKWPSTLIHDAPPQGPKWCQVLKPMTCQACSPPRLLNLLRKPQEGPVILLASEQRKRPASMEGSHCLENLHACIFLPSVWNPSLAYERDRFEHFQHTLPNVSSSKACVLCRPNVCGWAPPSTCICRQTPRPYSITSVSYGQPLTEWSLHAPVATT